MGGSYKRQYKRLPIKLDLSYVGVDSTIEKSHNGSTVNVSPDGLYFETAAKVFKTGSLLKWNCQYLRRPVCLNLEAVFQALAGF